MLKSAVLIGSDGSSVSFGDSKAFSPTAFWGRLLRGGVTVDSCSVDGGGSARDALLLRVLAAGMSCGGLQTREEGFCAVFVGIARSTGCSVIF